MTWWQKFKQIHEDEGEGAWERTFIAGISVLAALVSLIVLVIGYFRGNL